jgi:DNA end-binding protein Ku
VMLEAFDKGLLATTLRYAYEVRDQGAYFEDIPALKLPAEMVQLAGHIIDTKAGHFDHVGLNGRQNHPFGARFNRQLNHP